MIFLVKIVKRGKMTKKPIREKSLFTLSSGRDSTGEVFLYHGKILRGITKQSEPFIKQLLKSGLIEELVKKNLFPKTKITNFRTTKYPLVLEHERIETLTYPYEWSFSMLQDAALVILKVNAIAKNYNYQTIDAHPANIMFDYTSPKFIDLGSFIKLENNNSWFASEEFIQRFYYPLRLWSAGYKFMAKNALLPRIGLISHLEYQKIINPLTRLIPGSIYSKLLNNYFPFSRLAGIPEPLLRSRLHPYLFAVLTWLKKRRLLPFQNFNDKEYSRRILTLQKPRGSYWSDYRQGKRVMSDRRYRIIAEIIHQKKINSLVDYASNKGLLVRYMLGKGYIKTAVCIDNDSEVIDDLYIRSKREEEKIIPIAQNVVSPLTAKTHRFLEERFQADAVLALAITHHLLLSQYFPIDQVLGSIVSLSKKYVLVEFMPLGLWNGKYSPPVPEWYTQKWFEEKLSEYCKIEEIISLGENRILFVGKKRDLNYFNST